MSNDNIGNVNNNMVKESHVRRMKKDAYYVVLADEPGLILTTFQLRETEKDNNYAEWAKAMRMALRAKKNHASALAGPDHSKDSIVNPTAASSPSPTHPTEIIATRKSTRIKKIPARLQDFGCNAISHSSYAPSPSSDLSGIVVSLNLMQIILSSYIQEGTFIYVS
ncbi:hypothetical protein M9H77_31643 [Catharanthus roseus]|uniref:Uncharacterized protein n=1 Tax=Catharanthus roseus TaxID=4058 RepID=A0ACC0A1L6_CATRO|nr:hypothetical protein M9H77_31643 [Catharanthus roseus]